MKRIAVGTTLEIDFQDAGGYVDVSQYLSDASLSMTSDTKETTNYRSDGWKEFLQGLKSAQLGVNWRDDVDASALEVLLWNAYDAGTVVAWKLRGKVDVPSDQNAEYGGSCLIQEFMPIGGSVGELDEASHNYQVTGPVTRAVA